ncbi:MAG: protein-glutamate O-methyltransferase CheR [Thermodesulfobacteriota bacterium]
MKDSECIELLQWALPRLGLRWPGFRKVRRQVCRRLARRLGELGLDGVAAYRNLLKERSGEWQELDRLCRITISRFLRDREVYDFLADPVFPALAVQARARGEAALRCWSAGCCAGEEPYTLALLWQYLLAPQLAGEVRLEIVATDVDPAMLARARAGRYGRGSLRELPAEWVRGSFRREQDDFVLSEPVRSRVAFLCHDLRDEPPFAAQFQLILCRNLAFTYFDAASQLAVLARLCRSLRPGGALVIGCHERLPDHELPLTVWQPHAKIFRYEPSVV